MRIKRSWRELGVSWGDWWRAIGLGLASVALAVLFAIGTVAMFPKVEKVYEDRYVSAWMDQYRDYVVRITSEVAGEDGVYRGFGSGYVLVSGRILTAYHVVEEDSDGRYLLERWDSNLRKRIEYWAIIVKFNRELDIAELQLESGFIPGGLELGSSSDMGYNRLVHVVGCPSASFPPSLTSGVLRVEGHYHILIDCGLWYGHSGGPIIDGDSGKIIGMAVQIGFREGGPWSWGVPQSDLGLGLHVDRIKEFLYE